MFNLYKYIDGERLIHSLKTMIACLIGFTFMKLLGKYGNQWIIISIIVVMCSQLYVGSVLQKSYLRFLATMIGCLFAILVLVTVGYDNIVIAIALGLTSFIFSYIATSQESLSYAGTLGAVTTVIILLDKNPTVIFALQRFLEISLGIFIASFVSQFVLPIHARTHLKRAQITTLKALNDYYINIIIKPINDLAHPNHPELEEIIVKSLLKQRQLAKESKGEPFGLKFNINIFNQFLFYEREMLRAIVFMFYAKNSLVKMQSTFLSLSQLFIFHEKNKQALTTLVELLELKENSNTKLHLSSLSGLKNILHQQHQFSYAELSDINVFLFAADIFSSSLEHFAKLHNIQVMVEK